MRCFAPPTQSQFLVLPAWSSLPPSINCPFFLSASSSPGFFSQSTHAHLFLILGEKKGIFSTQPLASCHPLSFLKISTKLLKVEVSWAVFISLPPDQWPPKHQIQWKIMSFYWNSQDICNDEPQSLLETVFPSLLWPFSLPVLIFSFWQYLTNLPLGFFFFFSPLNWFFLLAFHQQPSFLSLHFLSWDLMLAHSEELRDWSSQIDYRVELSFMDVSTKYLPCCSNKYLYLFVQQPPYSAGLNRNPDLLFFWLQHSLSPYFWYLQEPNRTRSTQLLTPKPQHLFSPLLLSNSSNLLSYQALLILLRKYFLSLFLLWLLQLNPSLSLVWTILGVSLWVSLPPVLPHLSPTLLSLDQSHAEQSNMWWPSATLTYSFRMNQNETQQTHTSWWGAVPVGTVVQGKISSDSME